jgi:hypothetical protein
MFRPFFSEWLVQKFFAWGWLSGLALAILIWRLSAQPSGTARMSAETVPANEDEAQRGLNDTFPGDPYPAVSVLQAIRQRSVQALHAGISRRDWWATETAANELRDQVDDLIRRMSA